MGVTGNWRIVFRFEKRRSLARPAPIVAQNDVVLAAQQPSGFCISDFAMAM